LIALISNAHLMSVQTPFEIFGTLGWQALPSERPEVIRDKPTQAAAVAAAGPLASGYEPRTIGRRGPRSAVSGLSPLHDVKISATWAE
jgi:hypothetical protein